MEIWGGGSGGVMKCCYAAKPLSPIHYFGTQIGYVDRPVAMDRYDALEPTYCLELIEMLGAYGVPSDISGHGLRERGLGNCSSRTSWSLPQ